MTEAVLNQDEIRDLLNQSAPAGAQAGYWEGEVAAYDLLGSASKTKDKLEAADKLHQEATKLLGAGLSSEVGSEMTVEFAKHDLISGSDALAELAAEQVLVFPWKDTDKGLEGLFRVDRGLFFQCYDTILGGNRVVSKKDGLTPLEQSFANRLMASVVKSLEQIWGKTGAWKFPLGVLIDRQDQITGLSWNFDCFRATFKINIGAASGELVAVLPCDLLNALTDNKEAVVASQEAGNKDHLWEQAVLWAISDIPLSIKADLGSVRIPLKNVLGMKANDQFSLALPADGHLVLVQGKPAFRASIGTMEGNRAIQVITCQEGIHE